MNDSYEVPSASATQKADAHVGRFFREWGMLEASLNRLIIKSMNLGVLEGAILTGNLHLKDKLNIVKTLIYISFLGLDDNKKYTALIAEIEKFARTYRNSLAHEQFIVTPNGDLKFFVVRAKGKLDFPEKIWGEEKFLELSILIFEFNRKIIELTSKLENSNALKAAHQARDATGRLEISPLKLLGLHYGLGLLSPSDDDGQGNIS